LKDRNAPDSMGCPPLGTSPLTLTPHYTIMNIGEEKKIVDGCLAGDKSSWDTFVRKYTKLIYNSIYRTLELKGYRIEPDLVEDLHQEVFLSLLKSDFKKLRTFRWERNCSLATWLCVVTRNLVLNFIRSDYKHKNLTKSLEEEIENDEEGSLEDMIRDEKPSIKEEMDKESMANLLSKHLEKLDTTERTILEMFYIQNLPLEEIARVLGKSEDAVFMQKKRIIGELQKKIKKDVGF